MDHESISNPGVKSLGFIRLELLFREYYVHGIESDYIFMYQIYETVWSLTIHIV